MRRRAVPPPIVTQNCHTELSHRFVKIKENQRKTEENQRNSNKIKEHFKENTTNIKDNQRK
jgi:hypothetical protein